jgi:hypothetical protein
MYTPADEPDAPREGRFRFHFQTPFGTFTDVDDLPQDARAFVVEHIDALGLSDEVRAHLEQKLQVRGPKHAAPAPSPVGDVPEGDADAPGQHAPGCTCDDDHRTQVWSILDQAFPTSPHLWRAGEALFALSAVHPRPTDTAGQIDALQDATRHLEHHAAAIAPPLSPADQLVERFRKEMGGL